MKQTLISTTVAIAIAGVTGPQLVLAKATDYKATIDIDEPSDATQTAAGRVFEDLNRNGDFDAGEPGIPDVMVSNGKQVVKTDHDGLYSIPNGDYREDMNIFVSKPACYDVPVDEDNVPQFFYIHKENGSAKPLVFGGLEATGKLPSGINFPLIKGECQYDFTVAISGDPQPYSNIEVGYVRDTLAKELAERDDIEAIIVEGDVMGDDMGLLPRFLNNLSAADAPQYLVVGNHDLDFDADTDADSSLLVPWGCAFFLLAAHAPAIRLKPYQRLDSTLSTRQHQVYRTLLSSVGDIEDQRVQEGQWPEAVLLEEEGIPPFAVDLMPAPADRLQWVSYDGGTWVDYLGTDVDDGNPISYILRLIDLHGTYHPHPHPGVDYDPERSVGVQVWTFNAPGRDYPVERLPEAGWTWVIARSDPMFAGSSPDQGTIAAPQG